MMQFLSNHREIPSVASHMQTLDCVCIHVCHKRRTRTTRMDEEILKGQEKKKQKQNGNLTGRNTGTKKKRRVAMGKAMKKEN